MFDDIIDHSYDEVLNDRDRLFKIAEEIKRLNNNKELVKEFYRNNYDRFEKNKNIIYNILKNTDDYLFFRSLV
jgi:phosphoribosylaminoimidazole-succinocarboxamide synthase